LGRLFAKATFRSDNSLTLILLFSAGTKPSPRLYRLWVICVAWKELWVRYRKKVGVLLELPAGQYTGLLLHLFFLTITSQLFRQHPFSILDLIQYLLNYINCVNAQFSLCRCPSSLG
jgi:hypothetical protein